MARRLVLAAVVALGWSVPAWAECGANAGEGELRECLAQDLRDSDKRINAVYKALMGSLDEAAKVTVRDAQRAWLKKRDRACDLDSKETDREKWLQGILADQERSVCVVRYTFTRVAELDALLTAKGPAAPADLPPAPVAPAVLAPAAQAAALPATLAAADEGYALVSRTRHQTGRWYYEVWIDRAGLAARGDMLMNVGFAGSGTSGVVRSVNVRRSHVGAPPVVLGLAIDLQQGAVYIRHNGEWKAAPGSNGGTEVKLGRDWSAGLTASTELTELVRAGLIKINLGERPFDYALPDGYRPLAE